MSNMSTVLILLLHIVLLYYYGGCACVIKGMAGQLEVRPVEVSAQLTNGGCYAEGKATGKEGEGSGGNQAAGLSPNFASFLPLGVVCLGVGSQYFGNA